MAAQSPHQLSEIRQYAAAGAAVDAVTDAPTSANVGSYIFVVTATAPNNSLELTYANGNTRAITVAAGQEIWAEFTAVTLNTTAGPVQVGWE